MGFIDYIEARRQHREKEKKLIETTNENIEKIKKHWSTLPLNYPKYQEAFDYVDELFPHCNVKNVIVYKANKDFLAKLGYAGVGGFCHRSSKSVVLSSHSSVKKRNYSKYQIFAAIKPDEVIVHELIHYCYFFENNTGQSVHLNEEFAYGYSVYYLRDKGFSDEEIIKNNFLPYLYKTEEDKINLTIILNMENMSEKRWNSLSSPMKQSIYKKYRPVIYDKAIENSYKRGHKIIEIYSRKIDEKRGIKRELPIKGLPPTKFDFLDI